MDTVHPFDRIRARAPMADQNVPKQHVLSKVIGKRFAATVPHRYAGLVEIVDVKHLAAKSRFLGPDGFGYVKHFVGYASKSMEELWQTVETNLDDAITACEDRSIFSHPHHVKTVKDAIALHLVRNIHMRPFLDAIWDKFIPEFKANLLNTHRDVLIKEFTRRYGLLPGGPESLETVLDDALAPHLALRDADAYFRDSLERLFGLARRHLDMQRLEVSTPGDGEFIVGDAPAVAVGSDGRLGVVAGVGVGSATTIALPLGPSLLVSTGEANTFLELDKSGVDRANFWQIQSAAKRAYCRPGSGLDVIIREWRRAAQSWPGSGAVPPADPHPTI